MNWLAIILSILAGVFILCAVLGGLFCPQEHLLTFAEPKLRTRKNAFWFYMRFALICAVAATGMYYDPRDASITMWAGLISGFLLWKAWKRFSYLYYGVRV